MAARKKTSVGPTSQRRGHSSRQAYFNQGPFIYHAPPKTNKQTKKISASADWDFWAELLGLGWPKAGGSTLGHAALGEVDAFSHCRKFWSSTGPPALATEQPNGL